MDSKTSHIYVVTHKPLPFPLPPHYRKLYVGAVRLAPEEKASLKGYVFDDSGVNISGKNSSYCELTGLYWLWKNQPDDAIVGITHYRRFFGKQGKYLSIEGASRLLQKADMVVARRQWVEKNVKIHFETFHSKEDLCLLRSVIQKKYPEYLESFDCAMSKCFLFSYNMMVCRKEVFDAYCVWLFDILEECEGQADLSAYDDYQKRIFGFLAERLLLVYLLHHQMKVAEVPVLETELDKSAKWASDKWKMITVAKNFFTNRGVGTMRYRRKGR